MLKRQRISTRAHIRRPLIFGAVAALLAAPLVAIGGNAAYQLVEGEGTNPVNAMVSTMPLADGASVLVDDAAIATQSVADAIHPNRGVVKELRRDEEFSMFALTWTGSADVASYFRAQRPDGTWSEWYSAEPEYPASANATGVNGTELIYVEPTKAVQVSTHGLDIFSQAVADQARDIRGIEDLNKNQADRLIASLTDATGVAKDAVEKAAEAPKAKAEKAAKKSVTEWSNIEPVADEKPLDAAAMPAETPAEAPATGAPATNVDAVFIDGNAASGGFEPIVDAKNATGMPKVITRAGWGADESKRCLSPSYDSALKGATVHHTAGSNNYTEAQSAGIVRGIYAYHGQTLGWCDVGYNALVDKYGNIFEGRYGGLDKNVQGAHAGGFNKGTFGISMMGDYSSVQPSQAMINAVGNMIGWRLKVAGLEPTGTTKLTSSGYSGAKYAAGQTASLNTIFAHRDTGYTTCPGDAGFAQMGTIRSIAKKKFDSLTSGNVTNESKEGTTDLVVNKGDKSDQTNSTSSNSSTTSKSDAASQAAAHAADAGGVTTPSTSQNTDEPTQLNNPTSESPQISDMDRATAVRAISGARSMLASALGLLGAPGLAQTADAILMSVGQSVENGPSLDDLPVLVGKLLDITDKNDLVAEWIRITDLYGNNALGQVESGVQTGATLPTESGNTDTLSYVKFDKGLITSSPSTGTNAIWGEIAEAWAKQGFEVGALGAPVSSQTVNGDVATAEFQNGTITWNTLTGAVDVLQR